MYKRRFIDYVVLYLKGILMGTANKIPGVSGGMIALVSGFYEELIYSFQKINIKSLNLLLNGRFNKFLDYINFKFLFAINFGSVSAFFSVSLLLDWLMRTQAQGGLGYGIEVWSYFFGLIIGSVYYVARNVKRWSFNPYLGMSLGAILGLLISFMDPMAPNDNYWFIFLCGIISVSGMTLPGFSGSFILIILGNYNLLLVDAVNNLFYTLIAIFQGDFKMLGTESLVERAERIRMLIVVSIFAIGSLFGLVSFSKIMGYMLKHYHNTVIATLMGFIIGSLGAAWPWKNEDLDHRGQLLGYTRYLPEELDWRFAMQILWIIIGILTILIIDFYERRGKLKL
ncbi:MAG: DUF368 domain-containing protein [Flavobacteriaceae bacterium]|nr:DUF368 domain-containing protein [Flavobacteriaceae bacterium]